MSTLIAVDLEPTESGVRRINGALEEFAGQHHNGTVTGFPAAVPDDEGVATVRVDAYGGRLSA